MALYDLDAHCPVCEWVPPQFFREVEHRRYWRCPYCHATYLDRAQLPDGATELDCYRYHRNDPDDPRYRRFLLPAFYALVDRLGGGALEGLDYGSGNGSAMAAMLEEVGYRVTLYDPYFRPDAAALERQYDFITCTEVVEHFHEPGREFDRLNRLLKPGGWLVVLTTFLTEDAWFAQWHYRRDPTHVIFYKPPTFRCIAAMRRWTCDFPAGNVALFRRIPGVRV